MMSKQKETVLLYAELINTGQFERFSEVMEDDFEFENSEGEGAKGIETMKVAWKNFRNNLGGEGVFSWDMKEMFEEGNVVTATWVIRARQDGVFKGYAPTQRSADYPGMSLYRFNDNGKLSYFFGYPGTLKFLQDLKLFCVPSHG